MRRLKVNYAILSVVPAALLGPLIHVDVVICLSKSNYKCICNVYCAVSTFHIPTGYLPYLYMYLPNVHRQEKLLGLKISANVEKQIGIQL